MQGYVHPIYMFLKKMKQNHPPQKNPTTQVSQFGVSTLCTFYAAALPPYSVLSLGHRVQESAISEVRTTKTVSLWETMGFGNATRLFPVPPK